MLAIAGEFLKGCIQRPDRTQGSRHLVKNAFRKFRSSDDTLIRVLRNSAWLFTGNGVVAVLSFFYLAILTRTLGPEGFGRFVLIFSTVQMIAFFLRFQTWQTIVHFGVRYVLERDPQKFSALSFFGIVLETAGALIGCVLAWFLIPVIGDYFEWSADFVQTTRIYAIAILLCVKSSALGILRAHDRFRDGAVADAMIPIGRLVGASIVLLTGPSVMAFLAVWAAAEVLSAVTFWILVLRNAPLHGASFSLSQIKQVVTENEGIRRFFMTTAATDMLAAMREHLLVVIIGFLIDVRAAGLFRLANQLANALNRIAEMFSRPLFTELSRIHASADFKEFRRLFYRSLRLSFLTGVGVVLALIAIGQPMILLMAGEEFIDAYPLLVVLGAASGMGLIGLGLEPLLQASGRAHVSLIIRIGGLALIVALLFALTPIWQATGAAYAMLIVAALTLAVLLYTGFREIGKMKRRQTQI